MTPGPLFAARARHELCRTTTRRSTCSFQPIRGRTRGSSLAGILVGLVLALVATLLATQLLLVARTAYAAIAEDTLIEAKGQQALELITTQIRQAGWSATGWRDDLPAIVALSRCEQLNPGAIPTCTTASTLNSEALQIRFDGQGHPSDPGLPDESMIDCSGQGVPLNRVPPDSEPAGWSIFYLGKADDGEPQLLCRYPSRQGGRIATDLWTFRSLIRGIEHMRFRFGIDDDSDGTPDRHLETSTLGSDGALWRKVASVEIALVVRAERRSATGPIPSLLLFRDPDLYFSPREMPDRLRKVMHAVVQLRNPPPCRTGSC
jgi:type IV pilus assembly protein PilW